MTQSSTAILRGTNLMMMVWHLDLTGEERVALQFVYDRPGVPKLSEDIIGTASASSEFIQDIHLARQLVKVEEEILLFPALQGILPLPIRRDDLAHALEPSVRFHPRDEFLQSVPAAVGRDVQERSAVRIEQARNDLPEEV